MDLIALDFETYYDKQYSLSKLTTEEYIRDDRFEVIGLSVKINNALRNGPLVRRPRAICLRPPTLPMLQYSATILCLMELY